MVKPIDPWPAPGPNSHIIFKVSATISLGNLHQSYTGTPLPVTVTTNPSGLAVTVTYNGSTTVPTAQGSYTVVAIVADTNYTGKANGTLIITP